MGWARARLLVLAIACVALAWRAARRLSPGRSIASLGFALLVPVALSLPSLAALAFVTAVWLALRAYELVWWREARAQHRRAARAPVSV